MKILNALNFLTLQKVREIVETPIQIGFFKEIINILELVATKKKRKRKRKKPPKNVMNRAPASLLDHEKLKKYA